MLIVDRYQQVFNRYHLLSSVYALLYIDYKVCFKQVINIYLIIVFEGLVQSSF